MATEFENELEYYSNEFGTDDIRYKTYQNLMLFFFPKNLWGNMLTGDDNKKGKIWSYLLIRFMKSIDSRKTPQDFGLDNYLTWSNMSKNYAWLFTNKVQGFINGTNGNGQPALADYVNEKNEFLDTIISQFIPEFKKIGVIFSVANEFESSDIYDDDTQSEEFAEVLEELLMGEYESEFEASENLDDELEHMANEYFTKRAKRKRRRRGRHNKRGGGFIGKALRAGGKLIQEHGKKLLKGLVSTMPIPGASLIGGAIVDAAIKDEFAEFAEYEYSPQEIAKITKEAFEFMADDFIENGGEDGIDEREARQIARRGIKRAIAENTPRARVKSQPNPRRGQNNQPGNRRVIHLKPGEEVVIKYGS